MIVEYWIIVQLFNIFWFPNFFPFHFDFIILLLELDWPWWKNFIKMDLVNAVWNKWLLTDKSASFCWYFSYANFSCSFYDSLHFCELNEFQVAYEVEASGSGWRIYAYLSFCWIFSWLLQIFLFLHFNVITTHRVFCFFAKIISPLLASFAVRNFWALIQLVLSFAINLE